MHASYCTMSETNPINAWLFFNVAVVNCSILIIARCARSQTMDSSIALHYVSASVTRALRKLFVPQYICDTRPSWVILYHEMYPVELYATVGGIRLTLFTSNHNAINILVEDLIKHKYRNVHFFPNLGVSRSPHYLPFHFDWLWHCFIVYIASMTLDISQKSTLWDLLGV